MSSPTDWTSALAVLAAGLILGALIFFIARRRKTAPAASTPAPAPAPAPRPRTAVTGFVWGVVCTLVVAGIAYYATRDTTNVDEQIVQAKDAFARNDLMGAFEKTNAVLAKNPDDPRALTYNAVVRLSMGEVDKASSMLERATQRDPKLIDAWVALAQARMHAGQQKEAAAAIEAAIAQHPEEEKRIRDIFTTMQKTPAAATNLPPDHPPLPGAEMPSSSQPIHITMSLDPKIADKGGIIYVIARGDEKGHPIAVRRIDTNAFPVSIDFGAADSMMGGTLPPAVRIEARLDSDGDAGTNNPADPRAVADGVKAGSSVTLELRAN